MEVVFFWLACYNKSMTEKEIKWGFAGCGKVVQKKSGKAFNEAPNSCVYAIMRRDIDAAKKSAEMFGAERWFDNLSDILTSGVDAIYIATPPGLHYEQAMMCCKAGKPVYIEKPLARNYREAKEIVDAFEMAGVPIFVGHYRRALPRFIHVKDLIDRGAIGKVTSVRSYLNRIFSLREAQETWLYNPALSGGGKFYDIAAHSIDIVCYLVGNISEVHGFAKNSGTECPLEDAVAFAYKTESGVIGTANFNCIADNKNDRMVIVGADGAIEFSVHGKDDVVVSNYAAGTREVVEIPDPETIEGPMVQTVVEDLLGTGKCPCTGSDALPTYWAIDQVLDEFYGGRQRDFWAE